MTTWQRGHPTEAADAMWGLETTSQVLGVACRLLSSGISETSLLVFNKTAVTSVPGKSVMLQCLPQIMNSNTKSWSCFVKGTW